MSFFKIVVFVPTENADNLRQAIGDAGAGNTENYSHASFSSLGIGRFLPKQDANPAIGKVGELTEVEEERIEIIAEKDQVKDLIDVIKNNHPYEEVALDIYPVLTMKDFE